MSDESTSRAEQYGGCPTCGAGPDKIQEGSKYSPSDYYCGACGCPLGGDKTTDTE